MPKFNYSYDHNGYIAEDDDHVSFNGKGVVEAKNLDEAIIKAMTKRRDGDECNDEWINDNCSVEKTETSATVVWSFSDCDGDGKTVMSVTLQKGEIPYRDRVTSFVMKKGKQDD